MHVLNKICQKDYLWRKKEVKCHYLLVFFLWSRRYIHCIRISRDLSWEFQMLQFIRIKDLLHFHIFVLFSLERNGIDILQYSDVLKWEISFWQNMRFSVPIVFKPKISIKNHTKFMHQTDPILLNKKKRMGQKGTSRGKERSKKGFCGTKCQSITIPMHPIACCVNLYICSPK